MYLYVLNISSDLAKNAFIPHLELGYCFFPVQHCPILILWQLESRNEAFIQDNRKEMKRGEVYNKRSSPLHWCWHSWSPAWLRVFWWNLLIFHSWRPNTYLPDLGLPPLPLLAAAHRGSWTGCSKLLVEENGRATENWQKWCLLVTSDDNWFDCEVQAMVEEGEGDEERMKVDANVVNAIIDKIWRKKPRMGDLVTKTPTLEGSLWPAAVSSCS